MTAMNKWKRHTDQEISAKLSQASSLAASGAIQKEIADRLGISVMTYHRWRRKFRHPAGAPIEVSRLPMPNPHATAGELEHENALLRRLLTDLLLEKMALEERPRHGGF